MKFIHMADLHLGKRVNEYSMIEDQKYILEKIKNLVISQKADALLISGDIYDKPLPPVEAVELFDSFLNFLAASSVPVLIISGNHDSQERLNFGSGLMKNSKVYISAVYNGSINSVTLNDEFGRVNFYFLPYIKPSIVRPFFPDEKIESYSDAVRLALSGVNVCKDERNVLLAHQFVTGAKTCQSEELYVGGSENIDLELFSDFDYVALGHLHGPQKVGRETVRYSGSPLKYSFSEANQKKELCLVEMKEKGNINITSLPLHPLHDMKEIKGRFDDLTDISKIESQDKEDYVHITLTDEIDIPDGFRKLKDLYKNLMKLDYDNSRTSANFGELNICAEKLNPLQLFEEFFALQNNKEMTEDEKIIIKNMIENIWGDEK